MLAPLFRASTRLGVMGLLSVSSGLVSGQNLAPQGSEYPIAGLLRGDQVFPHVSLNGSGGYLVWQDNATDGDGFGISARRLNANLTSGLGVFRVNEQGAGDQQHPKVKLLSDGGAAFVWQGGPIGDPDIYARFLASDGTFVTGDVRVNRFTPGLQITPALALLSNGDVLVTWSSYGQDGSLHGVFAQRLSSAGDKIGEEFQVNQYTSFNQRTPAVAGLANGGYVIAWASEQKRFENSVDIYARVFGPGRNAIGNEFLVNTSTNICANPAIAAASNGGFVIGWSQRDIGDVANAWDVFARVFKASGEAASAAAKVNTHENGNHYAPQIASNGDTQLVVWTSYGQDGSREGVFGRFMDETGAMLGGEFQVNTFGGNQQMHPAVGSDGANQFLAVWTSFVGGSTSFDLFGQRYARTGSKPAPPFVAALSSTRLSVTWPEAANNSVTGYELYIDNGGEPVLLAGNIHTVGSLAPGSAHSFRMAYRFADGSRSPLSDAATGRTWGSDENHDGLPDDWQSGYWGDDPAQWPDPRMDSDGDGASDLEEFMAGTNPKDAQSVLRTRMEATPQGNFLHWNTQPGFVYQVQTKKTDVTSDWVDLGPPRFAAGASDSILVDGSDNPVYYRVKRLR